MPLPFVERRDTQATWTFSYNRTPVRIDIVTSITGVSWDEAYSGRVAGTSDSVPVYYIG